jgi:CheY-like chemotaxis protein
MRLQCPSMPISVVVAEHLRSSAAVITRLLETNGYAAAAVASAKAALAVCRERSVDIVISRVSFADSMNGVDLAYKLEGSGTSSSFSRHFAKTS